MIKNKPEDDNKDLGVQLNEFAFDFYKTIDKKGENTFFSPFSITNAFSLAYVGAKGDTKTEFVKTFHFSSSQNAHNKFFHALIKNANQNKSSSIDFEVANAIWGQKDYKLKKKYIGTLEKYFNSKLNIVDFRKKPESAKAINSWISDKTNGNIKDLVKEADIDEYTQLYLTNAIYFKANWSKAFDEKSTQKGMFHVSKDNMIKVDFMTQDGIYKTYVATKEKDPVSILELPYEGNSYSMLILMPEKDIDISHLLKVSNYNKWLSSLQKRKFDVIKIPKFKLDINTDLKKVLENMGMKKSFTEGANFGGISHAENLYISNASHRALIDVNEKGTKAAASTAIGMASRSAFKNTFIANRPFLFIIKDNRNNNILFMGKVNQPSI